MKKSKIVVLLLSLALLFGVGKNNLKYLVFYTEKEFKNWFETI